MLLKIPVTDETFIEMLVARLKEDSLRRCAMFVSSDELVGSLTVRMKSLLGDLECSNGDISTAVVNDLVDITMDCVKGSRSCMHNKSVCDDCDAGIHGLDERLLGRR